MAKNLGLLVHQMLKKQYDLTFILHAPFMKIIQKVSKYFRIPMVNEIVRKIKEIGLKIKQKNDYL